MRLRRPPKVDNYTLFISSSDESGVRRLRERVKQLVDDVLNPQLKEQYPEARVTLDVYVWERAVAQRAYGESVNDRFVRQVRESSLAVVLLLNELADGTREELEAALDGDVEVSLLVFEPDADLGELEREALERGLETYRSLLLYNRRLGRPDTDEAWLGLVRAVTAFAFAALRTSQYGPLTDFAERR
jgi:hypothetical protein